MDIKLNKRNLNDNENYVVNDGELNHYNSLKEKLKINSKKEIYCKLETLKILKEIKDNQYYKLDGYKSFDAFAKDFRLARAQVYNYLKIANAIEEGVIEEEFLIKNGILETLVILRNKETKTIKKSRQNPIKPLRFQLKSQDSYNFYKKNAKLTGFILDNLFSGKKDWLEEFIKEYEELRGK
ncbi:chromosome replication/partitioning protein (plasmid) [Borrelia miyamotoi]|uniref:Chromosome replication/partitioning protein n=2 Tax=Borrelia miyamotoi TaxID=47466 RepID=A0A482CZX3_9SPIR|nr:chromosome replication/partitioning protein [Borrelia miyamotoi]AHH05878.1 Putative plasmid partition protein [Borrelia miyamotoi FR64b]QBK63932.1 chromosome replication/partitioning protein [Borrelia miyamotoi]QBK65203.1 chromosome replication/partitioning protein [Borrelia miyamotoi]QBL99364.1 chromosome replication/partitioning protein [Borrelia miyamotoi]QFP42502.1 chromosome replication/partitioning protein [Borrelia miyamotoi]